MTDYLQVLLEQELESGRLDLARLPGAAERSRRLRDCHEQIHAALGLELVDRLCDLEGEESFYERLACFRHGFRLALRLMLELSC